jgi:hypothetical protein
MGSFIDQPITAWEEAFIPMELQATLRKATIVGDDGTERPLVKSEKVLLAAKREPPAQDPPAWVLQGLALGLVFGAALFGLAWAASRKHAAARIALGVVLSLLGLVTGFFAIAFLGLWSLTDHVVAYRNENILLLGPWTIVLAGTGLRIAAGRAASIHFGAKLVGAVAVTSLVALLFKVPIFAFQDNWLFLAFFIPMWGLAALGMRELARATPTSVPAAAPSKAAKASDAKPKSDDAKAKAGDAKSEATNGDDAKAESDDEAG